MSDTHSLPADERRAAFRAWADTLRPWGHEAETSIATANFLTTAFGADTQCRWQEGKNRTAAPDDTVFAITAAAIEQTGDLGTFYSLAWFLSGGVLRPGHDTASARQLVADTLAILKSGSDEDFHEALDRHCIGELEAFLAEKNGVHPEYATMVYPSLGKRNDWRNPNRYGPTVR